MGQSSRGREAFGPGPPPSFGLLATWQAPTRTIAFVVWVGSAALWAGIAQRPPLWPRGNPAPPPWVSTSGQHLVLSRAHLARPDAGVPRGDHVLGCLCVPWGWGLSHKGGQRDGDWTVGTRLLYLARNPPSPLAEEGRMFLPGAWPTGLCWGGLLLSRDRPPGPWGRRRRFSRAWASCSLGERRCRRARHPVARRAPRRASPHPSISWLGLGCEFSYKSLESETKGWGKSD